MSYYSECNYALEEKKILKIYANKIQTVFLVEQILLLTDSEQHSIFLILSCF